MKNKGFTLIELLVVISIIGVLASVVLTSVNSARRKARDARRVADLNQIKLALEFYYDDNGYYPSTPGGWDLNQYRYSFNATWDGLANDLRPYIPTLPIDPLNSGGCPPWSTGCYTYAYGNVGRNGSGSNPTGRIQYDLTAQFEDTNNPNRCGAKGWRFYFDNQGWCAASVPPGPYNSQVYEASVN